MFFRVPVHPMWGRGPVLVLLFAALLCAGEAQAVCHGQEDAPGEVWQPSVQDEFAASQFVLEGVALREEPVLLPSDQRLLLTRYTVRVLRAFKGKPGQDLVLTSKNTARQFPMEVGARYLLFVQKELIAGSRLGTHTHWYVYDCGNSGVLNGKSDARREVLALHARLAHARHAKHRHHRARGAHHT